MQAPDKNLSVDDWWFQLQDAIRSTALSVLRYACRKHQDWFEDNDADISILLAEKHRLHKACMNHRIDVKKATFFRHRRIVQYRLREMQDTLSTRKTEEIQSHADRNELKNFSSLKGIYGPQLRDQRCLSAPMELNF
nr:unnamed protein product [Spirometra erinaceieuropaei]